jgi:hypothetical protein
MRQDLFADFRRLYKDFITRVRLLGWTVNDCMDWGRKSVRGARSAANSLLVYVKQLADLFIISADLLDRYQAGAEAVPPDHLQPGNLGIF